MSNPEEVKKESRADRFIWKEGDLELVGNDTHNLPDDDDEEDDEGR